MTVYVALLRGIGPATHGKMPLGALAAQCATAGLEQVTRVGNTGNLVFASERAERAVETLVADMVRGFGLDTEVFVRTRRQIQMLVNAAPFPDAAAQRPGKLGVAFFRKGPNWPQSYLSYDGPERLMMFSNHLIVDYGGQISTSKLTIERTVGARMTQRNWTSVLRIAQRMRIG
ncbi:MAG: DUF1697 domain-containing protein [Devosia sp.]|nr:DUF1697 domain-containing protein [Devosia sp.]